MAEVLNVGIDDFFKHFSPEEVFGSKLAIIEINGSEKKTPPDVPVRLNALSILIASRGEVSIDVDYLTYKVKKNMSLLLIEHCIMSNLNFSNDFKGFHIVIDIELVREIMMGVDKLPMIQPGNSPRLNPISSLEESDVNVLLDHVQRLRKSIANTDNPFYKNIIFNEIGIFLMQYIYINSTQAQRTSHKNKVGHKDEIVISFIRLLAENCKYEHEVTFYSNELCITPEYLSRILKSFSGKTANKWISDALISEAKILLRRTDINIQEIAEELNFSDQSYFGKFFKKHTGKSPAEYKKSLMR